MHIKRNFARYSHLSGEDVYLYRNLGEFLDQVPDTGISSILYGQGTLDLQLIDRKSENLVVIFHAAADPAKTTLPIFVGHGITRNLDASVLFVSDPSLDCGIPIGWFAGDNNRHLQKDLTEVIHHIANGLGANNIIFQGSSAGGFAALFYSHAFPSSLAIPVNPQTDISKYHPDKVITYINTCWGGVHPTPSQAETNMLETYTSSFPNHVLFLQNRKDHFHLDNHYRPWAEMFSECYGERWCTLQGDWGEGHAAPPAYLQEVVLQFCLSFSGRWDELMKEDDFNDGIAFS